MLTNLSIFSSSICNLNCTYCYVKKEKAVFEYDEKVLNAIKNDEYIKRIQKDFPDSINTITTLELWGAEPSIHLNLIASKLKNFKQAFPNLNEFRMSSNYTLPEFIDNVVLLLQAMKELDKTEWKLYLQCSIDGLKEITDKNRGKGTTDKIFSNITALKYIDIPENVQLYVNNKATISRDSFENFIDLEFCDKYFGFLKEILNFKTNNKHFSFSAPTCVEPVYYTKHDGQLYSRIIDNFISLSKKYNYYFIPYIRNQKYRLSEYMRGGLCGQCYKSMTMLPDGYFSVCHRSGFDIIPDHYNCRVEESKKYFDRILPSPTDWIKQLDEYKISQNNMSIYYSTRNKNLFNQYYNTLKLLLKIGEISPIYYDDDILRKHIQLFLYFTICMQTNIELTGSPFICSSYFVPLFFNGAINRMYNYLLEKKLIITED